MNLNLFKEKKRSGEPISMVTCYDFWGASVIENSPIDAVLVGDSLAMVVHGASSTLHADMEMMVLHTKAVSRGLKQKPIISDLPFLSYRKDLSTTMQSVEDLVRAGAQAVKLEGVTGNTKTIEFVVQSGVPVMAHIGLTPQFVHQFGGFKVQGRNDEAAKALLLEARLAEQSGCFALVLECIPSDLACVITNEIQIPTIGIGAGVHTSGQILVLHDLLGFYNSKMPRFVRRFEDIHERSSVALSNYHRAVLSGEYPNESESYL